MIDKCLVKIISNKVVCDTANELKRHECEKREKMDEIVKNKRKLNHLVGIGMELTKYHPTVLRTMIDGGRNFKIPDDLKHQLINFANEAHVKGFNPSLFGYNTTLHKFIKTVHKIPKRKYIRKMMPTFDGKGNINNIELKIVEEDEPINNSESETDLDDILSEVEDNINEGNITEVKKKLKQYKHRIPKEYYKKIMNSI